MSAPHLAALPFNAPFLDCIAETWLRTHGTNTEGLILLPTRRSARALADSFLRAAGGQPLLLPRITAIGALDEAPLALAGALDLPPAVEPAHRLAALTRLVMALPQEHLAGAADRAWRLARELAVLMDQAERSELDLEQALKRAAAEDYATHWQVTLDFLEIVTKIWPQWLEDQGLMNPAARQAKLLTAQSEAWSAAPPSHPIWTVGMQGGIPSSFRLLRTVAHLPHGHVVLPGLDLTMDDPTWEALDDTHPQSGMRNLLAGLGATRGDVQLWDCTPTGPAARVALLSTALLPAESLALWRDSTLESDSLKNLSRLETADQQQEAVAIAMLLRDALEHPGHRAALVTPDRALAGRVAAELQRWGVLADDSAGEPLAHAPPAAFLRLLAATHADELGPVSLLSVLKHPLAAAGLPPAQLRATARALERACLRGPRPQAGLAGLRQAIADQQPEARAPLEDLLSRLEACLEPLLRLTNVELPPATLLAALIESAESLATTDERPGPAILWSHEEGDALATTLSAALPHLTLLPDQPPSVLPGLLDALLEGQSVRTRRALRGRNAGQEHPRVFIWGLLEAQLQSVDTVILGGLVEGVWPPATDPGPWLSRPMRTRAGLPSAEEAIGSAAHDFMANACAARTTILSCPRRLDGAPAVPARWLTRLEALLAGQGTQLPLHPASHWPSTLDQPATVQRLSPPAPRPPVSLRPVRLSVTEIETWLTDPYAIYARHILKLRPLDPLEQATDAADYGTVVHAGLHKFLEEHGHRWPARAPEKLRQALEHALESAKLRRALAEWWRPRLHRIAEWVCETERDRRSTQPLTALAAEVKGSWTLPTPRGFRLTGRADRIERRADSTLAILDYKTGQPPTQSDVDAGFAPQLLLEAAMAEDGAFPGIQGTATELAYWHLTGGYKPGDSRLLFRNKPAELATAVASARQSLLALILSFEDETRPYLSQPHAARAPRFSDYAQLARVAEWALSGEEEEA